MLNAFVQAMLNGKIVPRLHYEYIGKHQNPWVLKSINGRAIKKSWKQFIQSTNCYLGMNILIQVSLYYFLYVCIFDDCCLISLVIGFHGTDAVLFRRALAYLENTRKVIIDNKINKVSFFVINFM